MLMIPRKLKDAPPPPDAQSSSWLLDELPDSLMERSLMARAMPKV